MVMAEIKASLHNIRMASRKVRLVANLIKGLPVVRARAQMAFLIKKPAPLILKLLNSAAANAKHNFQLPENNLMVQKIVVEAGATLKRWLPRAMGRASAIHKRTCGVVLWLAEIAPSKLGEKTTVPVKKIVVSDVSDKMMNNDDNNDNADKIDKKSIGRFQPAPKERRKRSVASAAVGLRKIFRRKSI